MDAVDVALVDFSESTPQVVDALYHPFPNALREEFRELTSTAKNPNTVTLSRVGQLDQKLGVLFAEAINALVQRQAPLKQRITAAGSHGLTLWHEPEHSAGFTWQIGDANIIAAKTGLTTVADFRRRDVAEGGQGAPLASVFHQHYLYSADENRAVVNIGGMANITQLPADTSLATTGYDSGPGNNLMDANARKTLNQAYDADGKLAASGQLDQQLLEQLLADPYFQKSAPKSSGPEYFNQSWLQARAADNLTRINPADLQATLLELTATTIANEVTADTKRLLVCGGGVHNPLLIQRLKSLLEDCIVESTANHGLAPDWVEAILFAWLAKQRVEGLPGNAPAVTGAQRIAVLGSIHAA